MAYIAKAENKAEVDNRLPYAVVTWIIDNFSSVFGAATLSLNSKRFQLSRLRPIAWVLYIDTLEEKNEMLLSLKYAEVRKKTNTPDDPNKELYINFIADILDASGEHLWMAEDNFLIKREQKRLVKTFELSELRKMLPQQGPDCLTIRCYLLVHFSIPVNDMEPFVPAGIRNLSRQLSALLGTPLYSDVTLTLCERYFHLHKDMLLKRGSGLAALIMAHSNSVIRLLNYDDKSLEAVVQYLYSGDLRHIYISRRIMTYGIVERWEIPELEYCYAKESIKLQTVIEGDEFVFQWDINDFDDLGHSLGSSEYNKGNKGRWQLHIHPKGPFNADDQQKSFVFLEASLLDSRNRDSLNVAIELTCVNEENSILYARRAQKQMNTGESILLDLFLRGGNIMKRCLVNKTLMLRLDFRISNGFIGNSEPITCPPHSFCFDNFRSHLHFSDCMKSIFERPLNPDVTVCNALTDVKAHGFLLGARSSFFKDILNTREKIVSVPPIATRFLKAFLKYLYTGLTAGRSVEIICGLYEASAIFSEDKLKKICLDILKRNLDNVLNIMEVSDAMNLHICKSEVFQKLDPRIFKHWSWGPFKDKNPRLADEIIRGLDRKQFEEEEERKKEIEKRKKEEEEKRKKDGKKRKEEERKEDGKKKKLTC